MTFQLYLPETSFHFSLFMLHVLIFFLRCHPAPDVTLRFVHVQYLSCFLCQRRIDLHQSLRYVLMYRTLTDPKLFRRLPYRRIVFNNIVGNIDCAFLDIIFQRKSPQNTFLHCMKYFEGI